MEPDPESESDPNEASRNSTNGSAGRMISSGLRKARSGDDLDDSTSTSGGGSKVMVHRCFEESGVQFVYSVSVRTFSLLLQNQKDFLLSVS